MPKNPLFIGRVVDQENEGKRGGGNKGGKERGKTAIVASALLEFSNSSFLRKRW